MAWYIALASTDGTVRIWQADTGKLTQVLRGHTGSVHDVRWSPQLVSALLVSVRDYTSKNDHTRVWNAETGEEIDTLIGDGSEVREVR